MNEMKDRLIVALDGDYTPESFRDLMARLAGNVGMVKIGKKNFTQHGPLVVRLAQEAGLKVFLDLKFHDIPNTVAEALKAACALALTWLTSTRWADARCWRLPARPFPWTDRHAFWP